MDVYDRHFAHICPVLEMPMKHVNSNNSSLSLSHQVDPKVLARLQQLEDSVHSNSSPKHDTDLHTQVNLLEATIHDQAATTSLLENRVVGVVVKMADLVFNHSRI